jgi:hypothetical protein
MHDHIFSFGKKENIKTTVVKASALLAASIFNHLGVEAQRVWKIQIDSVFRSMNEHKAN